MKVKRIIRKITEEQKQEIQIGLPEFFSWTIPFGYSDSYSNFEQLSVEELKKRWDKEYEWYKKYVKKYVKRKNETERFFNHKALHDIGKELNEIWVNRNRYGDIHDIEEKEELREVEEKWEMYSHHKTIWRKELKELEESEEFKRLKELKEKEAESNTSKMRNGKGEKKRIFEEKIKPEIIKIQEKIKNRELLRVESGSCVYEDNLYEFDRGDYTDEQRLLLILELEDKERQNFERLKRKFSSSEETDKTPRRDAIPESVRIAVWRRDEGKCAKCGSRKNLEYDHIIPVSEGGSNTVRNIELLCEECNRKKRDNIE